jgi:mannose-1-phosphate guanylyltransferase / mannose-6-phosphate isomerase
LKLVPTIICGGAGSRLWPVSREMHPKPFIKLADGQSLLQKAWLRASKLQNVSRILTVSNRELYFNIRDEYNDVAPSNKQCVFNSYVLEPFGRNTAPAIAAAALQAAEIHGDDVLMLVLPADHLISDQESFANAVSKACGLAKTGLLVTFGIKPESPETGYGYIEADGNTVIRFVEKPNLKKAQEYLASGRHLWNSGMFCFSAGTLLREMEIHCPQILNAVKTSFGKTAVIESKDSALRELDPTTFGDVPDESIDYAVMEKSANIAVVPCEMGWSDIGSWCAMGDLSEPDENGNRIEGKAVMHNVNNCYIRSNERMVGAVGVDNLMIIDTPDALLIANRDHGQDVKHIYAQLKDKGDDAYKLHRTVYRPWGQYTVLEVGPRFQIKRIEVKPGASLSLQMHYHRSEHWIVVSGLAKIINGDKEIIVRANESTYIPAGHQHRLINPGHVDVVLIEVQSGEYLGEDDIVRLEDVYGRVAA